MTAFRQQRSFPHWKFQWTALLLLLSLPWLTASQAFGQCGNYVIMLDENGVPLPGSGHGIVPLSGMTWSAHEGRANARDFSRTLALQSMDSAAASDQSTPCQGPQCRHQDQFVLPDERL